MDNPRYEDNDDAYERYVDIVEMAAKAERKEVLALLYGFYFLLNQVETTPAIRTERRARVLSTIRRLEGRDAT